MAQKTKPNVKKAYAQAGVDVDLLTRARVAHAGAGDLIALAVNGGDGVVDDAEEVIERLPAESA